MRSLATVVAVFTCFGFSIGVAQAGARPKLSVAKVSVTPGKVAAGGKTMLKVTVKNRGAKRAKAKLSVRIDPSVPAFASRRIGKVRSRGSRKVKLKLLVPGSTPPAKWRFQVCVKPGKSCRNSRAVSVLDDSSWTGIEEAKRSGKLSTGKALLYEMYALSGDRRLPKQYRGTGDIPTGTVFANLATSFEGLPAADQAKLFPYTIQPRYRQSAWGESGKVGAVSVSAEPSVDCKYLDEVKGAWAGVEAKHAWFWFRPGREGARADAKRLAREFEGKIWPKLTGTFKQVNDASGAACDPAGDSKLDIYLFPKGGYSRLETALGVTPPIINTGDYCGPFASFIGIREGATRSTLAHEFMHTIQWNYRACDRPPVWTEGTATWAEDFVYPRDNEEHVWFADLRLPFLSLLANGRYDGYESWVFWYSLRKKGTVEAIKRVFTGLASKDFPDALEAGPSDGLRKAWERFSMQRFNQTPIGVTGFPEKQSFKDSAWDSLATKPSTPLVKVALGRADAKDFDLLTSTQPPLSTFFHRVKISDKKVRHLRFENGDLLKPGSMVQAFIKLASGKWRYEDWSGESVVNFCRDKVNENVVELIVATSNASARGGPIGAATHKLTAKNVCAPPAAYTGPISGTAKYDASTLGPGSNVTASWYGTVNLARIPASGGSSYPFFYQVDHENGGSLTYSVSGSLGGCQLEGTETFSLSELGEYPINVVTINGGDPVTYSINIPMAPGPVWQATRSGCSDPGLNGPYFWTPVAGAPYLAYSALPRIVEDDGSIKGSSTDSPGFMPQTMDWNLKPGH